MYLDQKAIDLFSKSTQKYITPLVNKYEKIFNQNGIIATSNEWLVKDFWKQILLYDLYYDLLYDKQDLNILGVGENISCATVELAKRHDYTLLDIASHENKNNYAKLEDYVGKTFVHLKDWTEFEPDRHYDVVIANDLFPNVDQRLYSFMDKFTGVTSQIRLSLTYYENTFWQVRRIQSGEYFTVIPWGLKEIKEFMSKYKEVIQKPIIPVYIPLKDVIFRNNRNVLTVQLNF